MRILFLSHRVTDIQIGGLAEFLTFLPQFLQKEGIDSVLYTAPGQSGQVECLIAENGMKHFTGPILKPAFWPKLQDLNVLEKICQEQQVDLVHAQGTYRAGYMAMHLKKKLGLPYVVTSHSDILSSNSKRANRYRFKRQCRHILAHCDAVTHLSPLMEQVSDGLLNCQHKSQMIHNGIVLCDEKDIQQELPYLLSIGRLEPEKGFRHLLRLYANLCQSGCRDALVIAGEGSDKDYLMQYAKELGLQVTDAMTHRAATVVFPGYVKGDAKLGLFQGAKLVLFATQPNLWQESFGIVQLEAMRAGKPIVASDMPSTRYLQSLGMWADLLPATDLAAWQAAVEALLSSGERRKELGALNRLAVRQFAWSEVARQYADLYRSL